ncbi:MAG: 50S ribosomal protein L22 [Candidatus Pacebacteria bacterium]|nr:50S ribosomal protein L22 [Candidatus Paceibacterota bacterium]
MKAALQNYRQSPRKVRLVADVIRGKKASDALKALAFVEKRAAEPVLKLLNSAIANAKANFQLEVEDLMVKEVQVNKGVVLKRIMPRARGSASRINKRSSHVSIILDVAKKAIEKPAKKKVTSTKK